jgi:hypothetical protein
MTRGAAHNDIVERCASVVAGERRVEMDVQVRG